MCARSLGRYAIFVCPILSGSGVRVKLLEAFAAGIPVVSTRVGAEGLAVKDGEFCALADDPAEFAARVVALLRDPERAAAMAERAREEVEGQWDMAAITRRLVEGYRGHGEGEANVRREAHYFPFRSCLMRLTMSLAVWSRSLADPLFGGSNADQITCRDFAFTRNTVPLARPKDELIAGFDSLFTVSPNSGFALVCRLVRFRQAAGAWRSAAAETVRRVSSRSPRRSGL